MMCNLLRPEERLDDLNIKGYKIIQNPNGFCFGIDAVLLSDFAKTRKNANILDIGTGTGIIPILMEAKGKGEFFTGLEIQEQSADMAERSVAYNHLTDKISIIQGDIKAVTSLFAASSFDSVTSNPPYMNDAHGVKNKELPFAIARHEIRCTLEDIIKAAAYVLKPGGSFFMIHKPFRLAEIFAILMKYKLEPKRMRLVHPYVEKEPNMVLIEAVRGAKSMIKIEAPLIVYQSVNEYTDEIYDIYGEMKGRPE